MLYTVEGIWDLKLVVVMWRWLLLGGGRYEIIMHKKSYRDLGTILQLECQHGLPNIPTTRNLLEKLGQ